MTDVRAELLHEELPADARIVSISAREGLSLLFEVNVVWVTEEPAVDLEALAWSSCAISLREDGDVSPPRFYHGVIEASAYLGRSHLHGLHRFRLTLRPSIHGLAYRVRTRLFQELATDAIIKQVFTDAGIADATVDFSAVKEYPVRELVSQFRESELAFVSRLLEQEGIHFRFEHSETDHVAHFVDYPYAHAPIAGDPSVPFDPRGATGAERPDSIQEVSFTVRNTHDAHSSRDWNWENPAQVMIASASEDEAVYPRHEWHGGFIGPAEGEVYAQVRREESISGRYEITGKTNCRRFVPGYTFSLLNVPQDVFIGDYLIVEVGLEYRAEETSASDAAFCELSFRAIPAAAVFRPPRVTPLPKVTGLERAVVTGPAGEEIHVNEFGQIKVHFEWDRENPVDDTASCWLRVMQMNTSGSMILPRVGWEMHVGFMDGDPSRPFAIHKAYNDEALPPYPQPANKTQSSLQTATSPGGGSTNELRMQDSGGAMELALSSSKDLHVTAGNNRSEKIGANAKEQVTLDATYMVGVDETIDIGKTQSLTVTKALNFSTVGDQIVTVGGTDNWGIKGGYTFATTASRTDDIHGLMNVLANKISETIQGDMTRTVGALQAIVSATAIAETVGGSKTETVGAAKIEIISKDKSENMKVAKTLNCGALTMKAGKDMGVAAKGAIAVNSAGGITETVGEAFAVTGKLVTLIAPKGLTLKGGSGTFTLSGSSLVFDASKFGGESGPTLEIKGPINYKK